MEPEQVDSRFVVCLRNESFRVSLEPRKIYRAVPDKNAAAHGLIRVIDESGDDYLFPADYFAAIELPEALIQALAV
ncbi:MAG TPA: hypothetical protein VJ123_03745 [Anaerolineales bacterium]|nr:hypothetical protein [Anaerolineales bacterium]